MRTSGRAPDAPDVEEPGAQPIGAGVEAGLPAPCPTCEGRGFLDQIDVARRIQHEHCTVCGERWSRPI